MPSYIQGVDVGASQGIIDWDVLKDHIDFAYLACTQYTGGIDPQYKRNHAECRRLGIPAGPYHFCYQGADPKAQMHHFYEHAEGLGTLPGDLPPAIDWEFCKGLTIDTCNQFLLYATNECRSLWYPRGERKCLVYTYPSFGWQHQPIPDGVILSAELWMAGSNHYTTAKRDAWEPGDNWTGIAPIKPWDRVVMDQFSGNGGIHLPGCSTDIDRDCFFGSSAEFDAWRGIIRSHGRDTLGNASETTVERQ